MDNNNFFLEDSTTDESTGNTNENDFQFELKSEDDSSNHDNYFLSGKNDTFSPSPNSTNNSELEFSYEKHNEGDFYFEDKAIQPRDATLENNTQNNNMKQTNNNNHNEGVELQTFSLDHSNSAHNDENDEEVDELEGEVELESEIENKVIAEKDMSLFQKIAFMRNFNSTSAATFLVLLVVVFEIMLIIAGFFFGKPLTFFFCLSLIVVQFAWLYIVYYRTEIQRNSTPFSRIIETYSVALFLESIIYFIQWIAWYSTISLALWVYKLLESDYFLWITIFLIILINCFIFQALLEESAKYLVLYRNSRTIGFQSKYSIILYSITSSLSIAFFTGTLATLLIYWQYKFIYSLASLFIEGILTTTVHVIAGTWIGIGYMKKHTKPPVQNDNEITHQIDNVFSTVNIILPSVLIHGCYACLIASLRMLYSIGQINWKLYIFVVMSATIFLGVALVLSVRKVRKVVLNPYIYHQIEQF